MDRSRYPSDTGAAVGRTYVELKIKLNGTSAATILSGSSWLATSGAVTHSNGTNVVTVKMRDVYPELIAHAVDIRDDTPNGAYATIGTVTNEGSTTGAPLQFNVNTWTAGGSASNDSTLTILITLALRNSTVKT